MKLELSKKEIVIIINALIVYRSDETNHNAKGESSRKAIAAYKLLAKISEAAKRGLK